jgi:hypothetical protein
MVETTTLSVTLPRDVKEALIADAESRGDNVTDTAVTILCERYGIAYAPRHRAGAGASADKRYMHWKVPRVLRRALRRDAAWHDERVSTFVTRSLREHYGLNGDG